MAGEVLTFLVTPDPLDLPLKMQPFEIPQETFAAWEARWRVAVEYFEMENGNGVSWTEAEREVAENPDRYLIPSEVTPQTIFRVAPKEEDAPLWVRVELRYGAETEGE